MSPAILPRTKTKTDTVSFRIDSSLRSALEVEAKKLGVSLNTLVAQIFNRYSGWGRYVGRLKLIPVSKDLLREIFHSLDKEEVIDMAKRLSETSGREHVLFLFQELSLDTVLRFFEMWSSNFDAYEHRYDGKFHFYTIHHDINLNFSLFVKEYVSALMLSVNPRAVRFETISPNSVTFSFEG